MVSGQLNKVSTTVTVDSNSILGRVKLRTIKIGIQSFPALYSAMKRDSAMPPLLVMGGGSLIRRPQKAPSLSTDQVNFMNEDVITIAEININLFSLYAVLMLYP